MFGLFRKKAPTREEYQACAREAAELGELVGSHRLPSLLKRETDHGFLCQVGVWYWQLGHLGMAAACYRRSIELKPEAPTYFNLAVVESDMAARAGGASQAGDKIRKGHVDEAVAALRHFYELVPSQEERSQAEAVLRQRGKGDLVAAASRNGSGNNR